MPSFSPLIPILVTSSSHEHHVENPTISVVPHIEAHQPIDGAIHVNKPGSTLTSRGRWYDTMKVENPRWCAGKTIDALYNKLPGHVAPAGARATAAAAAIISGLRGCQGCRAETKDLRCVLQGVGGRRLRDIVPTRWEGQQTKAERVFIFHCNHTCAPDFLSYSYMYILQARAYYL